MQVRPLAERSRQQHLFPLSLAEQPQVALQLGLRHIQFVQDGIEAAFIDLFFADQLCRAAAEPRRVLPDKGNAQAAATPDLAPMRDVHAAQQMKDTAFAAAVRPLQCDPLPCPHRKAERIADSPRPICDADVPQLCEPLCIKRKLDELQFLPPLQVFQEQLFLLQRGFAPLLDGLGARHRALRFAP